MINALPLVRLCFGCRPDRHCTRSLTSLFPSSPPLPRCCKQVIKTVGEYFLAQRVKEEQNDYITKLVEHHKVMVCAMKTKQTVDESAAEALKNAIGNISKYY